MKTKRTMALAISIFSLALAAWPSPALASTVPAQLVPSIKGEAPDKEHKDWVEVVLTAIAPLLYL